MLANLKYIFKLPDLRKRLLFTLAMIGVSRIGTFIALPGINTAGLKALFAAGGAGNSSLLGFVDLFSGGALTNFSIFSMGIIPYINASIIIQLMTIIMPSLKELSQEGESGRKQIAQYTRYLALGLGFFQGLTVAISFLNTNLISINTGYLSYWWFVVTSALTMMGGTAFLMWISELVTVNGIGNGASLIIFVGIISRMPAYVSSTMKVLITPSSYIGLAVLIAVMVLVVVGIVVVQDAQRKIPVQYAKKIVGNKMYGGQATYIPLKINQGGVLPIIFASSVLMFPAMLANIPFLSFLSGLSNALRPGGIWYMVIFAALIFFFTYFYTAITFNPRELADNIQKYGGFILGVRPGQPTVQYLDSIISRLTFVGATFLAIITILPTVTANITKIYTFMGLGGTALLIMVGVALDLMRQIDMVVVNSKYEGLIR
ncbi:preprotein translocase subunit SecY [Candidatus Termititenax spirochaetophilus]|uniref:Protein translocase subunit SecY n=1 Tax=Candidatus Termititenax spirochaetophilus TaxID=2218522 RepID=A0A388T8A5_9BACT|nr:preprotein translocase subunit SecY [Candidatus Termititenax spirochaetophilus]